MLIFRLMPDAEYPPTTIASVAVHTKVEENALRLASHVMNVAQNLRDFGVDLGEMQAETEVLVSLVARIEAAGPQSTVPQSEAREGVRTADSLGRRLIETGVDRAIRAWVADAGAVCTRSLPEANPLTGAPWADSLADLPKVRDVLSAGATGFYLIGFPDSQRQLLILTDLEKPIPKRQVRRAYRDSMTGGRTREARRTRFPIVDVHPADVGVGGEVSAEAADVLEEGAGFSFARLFGFSRRRIEPVVGWSTFSLDPELANLNEFSEFLTQQTASEPDGAEDDDGGMPEEG